MSGQRLGGSPERINKLTGERVGGTKMRNRGGTMLERPKQKHKPKTTTKPKPAAPTKSYVKNTFTVNRDGKCPEDIGKWRCKICKFMNAKLNEKCHMCSEPKTVLKEAAATYGGANAQRRAK